VSGLLSSGRSALEPSRRDKDIVDRWMSSRFPERSAGDYQIRLGQGGGVGAVAYRADLRNQFGDCYELEIAFEQFEEPGGASELLTRLNALEVGPRMRRLPNGGWVYDAKGELRRLRSLAEQPLGHAPSIPD
jgi:hypothetical protein